jgi:hypothetical protein
MHSFAELVNSSTKFALSSLTEAEAETLEALKFSGASVYVKNLQMLQLHRAIIAIGILSLFESVVQDQLGCPNGFDGVRDCLKRAGENDLRHRFSLFVYAINVLKHGRGSSYDKLIAQKASLPFRIKNSSLESFSEGDVSEIATLIEVDDSFIQECAQLIGQIVDVIEKSHSIRV